MTASPKGACGHVRFGVITNQKPGLYTVTKAHVSISVCHRQPCIDKYTAEAAGLVNETVSLYPDEQPNTERGGQGRPPQEEQ